MEAPNRIRQLYGYMVCLVAVVTALISLNGLIGNAINLSNPVAAASEYGEPIESFDAWMTSRGHMRPSATDQAPDTTSEETYRRRYEAARTSAMSRVAFRSRKSLVTEGVLLVAAVILFTTHWRWLRRTSE